MTTFVPAPFFPAARSPAHRSPHKPHRFLRRQQAGSAEGLSPFARRRHVPQLIARLSKPFIVCSCPPVYCMKTGERRVCRCTKSRTSAPVHGRSTFAGSFVRREALRRKGACSFSTTARAERYMSLRTPSARPSASFCPLRQRIFQSLPPLSLEKQFTVLFSVPAHCFFQD